MMPGLAAKLALFAKQEQHPADSSSEQVPDACSDVHGEDSKSYSEVGISPGPSAPMRAAAPPIPLTPSTKAVRMLWCDTAGVRRCRVIPATAWNERGVHITRACLAMPCHEDTPAPDAGGLTPVGEVKLTPLMSTLTPLPWAPGHAMVLTEFRVKKDNAPWQFCPRAALQKAIVTLSKNFDLELRVGFETEFVLLRPSPSGPSSAGAASAAPSGLAGAHMQGSAMEGSGYEPVDGDVYCMSSAFDKQAAGGWALQGRLGAARM